MILFLIPSCFTFYFYSFVAYSDHQSSVNAGQNISLIHCEFCLNSGNLNWTFFHKTTMSCANYALYSLYLGGTFQPGNLLNWQWLPHWVKWCTQASVPREQLLPRQRSSTEMFRKLTERKKGYSMCKRFQYMYLPSPDNRANFTSQR